MPTASGGLQLGPYQLVSPLGAGGMGEVWKARDTRINRIVAIKISQQQFSDRFEREARSIAALNHPNICALYDVGPDYLVMEYVDGSPLTHVQSTRKLLDVAVQIAGGLAAAHAAGIVHRDLKPDNVLLTREGRVKILDFGLAKHDATAQQIDSDLTRTASTTQPGVVMGTVSYMSPEQARGMPLDARSDQFSFGVMLYELACGKRPFQRETSVQTMTAIIEADPEPLPASVPAPLRWIVERCLAKEPSGRYESTRDLYQELRSVCDHLSEAVQSPPPPSVRSRRLFFATVGTIGLIVVGALCFWLGTTTSSGPQTLVSVPFTSSGGVVQNPSFSPDGSQVVFAWNGPRQTNFNLYVKLIGSNDTLRLTNDASDEGSAAWSPDGKHIAFVRNLGNGKCAVMITSPIGGAERKLTEIHATDVSPLGHSLLAWTPDSRYLAVPDGKNVNEAHGLYLVSVDTAERKPLTKMSEAEIRAALISDVDPAFSADGTRLAFVRLTGRYSSRAIWVQLGLGYLPAAAQREIRTGSFLNSSPLWASNGQLILSAGVFDALRLYRAAKPDRPVVPLGDVLTSGGLAIDNKTARLVFTSSEIIENLVQLPLTGTGEASLERLTATTGSDLFPRYSPTGKAVAFGSQRGGEFGIWTIQTTATAGTELTSSREATMFLGDWAPDGMSILFSATTGRGWWQLFRVAAETGRVTQLTNDRAHNFAPTSSRDGKWIYFTSSRSGQGQLYRIPTAGGSATVVVPRSVANAQESPDGQWLYFADSENGGGVSRMPIRGGDIERIVDQIADPTGYAVTTRGIYYWAGKQLHLELRFHDVQGQRDTLVFKPAIPAAPNLAISPDGRYLCFPQIEHNSQELMLIENFR